jgi:hypothetical protein
MGQIATGLSLVAQALSLVRTGLGNRKDPAVRFGDCEPHGVLKTSEPKMSAEGNVATLPNDVGIEGEDAMRPALVPPNSPLEEKLVDLEQKALVLGIGVGWFCPVCTCQEAVANAD